MEAEPWKALYRYWRSKHVGDKPLARRDLDPLIEITSLIANIVLLSVEDGNYRYSVVGSEVVERIGVNPTGQMIGLSITAPALRDQWRTGLDMAAREQKPQLFLSKMPPGVTARYVTLILPLVSCDGVTEKILVGIFFDGYAPEGTRVPGMSPLDLDA